MALQCLGSNEFQLNYQQAIFKKSITVRCSAPTGYTTFDINETFTGLSNDVFRVDEDIQPYARKYTLAGSTAYTTAPYPNDYSSYYYFVSNVIHAPYNAKVGNFESIKVPDAYGSHWEVKLLSDTIPDQIVANLNRAIASIRSNAGIKQTHTIAKKLDPNPALAERNGDIQGLPGAESIQPVRADPVPGQDVSYSPLHQIQKIYGGDVYWRIKIYKNNVLIKTLITLGCKRNPIVAWDVFDTQPIFSYLPGTETLGNYVKIFPKSTNTAVEVLVDAYLPYKKNVWEVTLDSNGSELSRTKIFSFWGLRTGGQPSHEVICTGGCPPGTCQVDCGNVYCCYGSNGIATSSFSK